MSNTQTDKNTSIVDEMKAEAIAMIQDDSIDSFAMWHNGNGNSMTTGVEGYSVRPFKDDTRAGCEGKTYKICLTHRVNGKTGRRTFRFTAGFTTITAADAEARLQAFAADRREDAPIELPENHAGVVVCYGGGVDSTAMLIALRDQGIRPDLITFADTGAEKPETYEQVQKMNVWLLAQGFPTVTTCAKKTLPTTAYNDLGGNCYDNETLPSLAFGMKSCSIKWKQGPQDAFLKGVTKGPNKRDPHPMWIAAQASGRKIVKLIGYDSGPADIRRAKKVKREDDDFLYSYPLQDLGWTRQDCIKRIVEEGLEVPIKSACFFCPASQKWELFWLAGTHPDLFMKALEIELRAMTGRHSRWTSDECTFDKDWLEFVNKPADQWPTTSITVGLGRSFAWNHWARENGIVDRKTGQFIGDRPALLASAEKLQGAGGNAADMRACA